MMENGNPQEVAETRMVENKELRQGRIDDLSNYTYCMVSTLNQMVNYLPMLLFPQMTQKLYITLNEKKGGGKNKDFDEALKNACAKAGIGFPSDCIELNTPDSTENNKADITGRISNDSKICWNITGGQRPILMAILDLAKSREGDYVMYLEGNEGKLVVQQSDGNGCLREVDLSPNGDNHYAFEGDRAKLNIRIALQLMGIEVHKCPNTFSPSSVLDGITAKYEKKENDIFRRRLLSLNKRFTPKTKGLEEKVKSETIDGKKLYFIEDVNNDGTDKQAKSVRFYNGKIWNCSDAQKRKYLLKDQDEAYLNQEEYDFLTKSYANRSFPFGHLLEEMFARKLWKLLNGSIADMAANLKLFSPKESINEQIDEIDIAILTKTGQLVVFEVKSGDMSGDVAKSTKYTTYAIAGVYGKPVLLTALLKHQFNEVEDLTKNKNWAYGSSAAAFQAARRAQLLIIALDGNDSGDFNAAMKKLLHL